VEEMSTEKIRAGSNKEITLVARALHRTTRSVFGLKKDGDGCSVNRAIGKTTTPTPFVHRLFGEYPRVVQTHNILTKFFDQKQLEEVFERDLTLLRSLRFSKLQTQEGRYDTQKKGIIRTHASIIHRAHAHIRAHRSLLRLHETS
jgi:hypothetical protein